MSLFSEFRMNPKIALFSSIFGALCNLVFLSSYTLIFFDCSRFSSCLAAFKPGPRFPTSWNLRSFLFVWKCYHFCTFSDPWGFLSRRIHSLVITSLFSQSVLLHLPGSSHPLQPHNLFPEGNRGALPSANSSLWASILLLWFWWALEPLQGLSEDFLLLIVQDSYSSFT